MADGSKEMVRICRVFRKLTIEEKYQLLNVLKDNSSVVMLDLSDMWLQPRNAFALCELLRVNKTIRNVNLSNTNIGITGYVAEQFADLLKTNRTLQYLDMSRNKFTINTVSYLFNGLNQNKNSGLKSINLSCNRIYCGGNTFEIMFKTKRKNLKVDFSGNAFTRNCKSFIKVNPVFHSFFSRVQLKSIFSPQYTITRDRWIVAIGADKKKIPGHAFGLVEGIRKNGQRFLMRYDLNRANKNLKSTVVILEDEKNPFKGTYVIDKNSKYIFRIFKNVTIRKAKRFVAYIKDQEGKTYNIVVSINAQAFNCTKVLIDALEDSGIIVREEKNKLQSWAEENIPRKGAGGRGCLVM
jgi:hypothetical protein